MIKSWKITTASAGLVATLAVLVQGQERPRVTAPAARSAAAAIVVSGTLDWMEYAQVAASQEGIIEWLEKQIGSRVQKDEAIGQLHAEIARLNSEKASLIAESTGSIEKAAAQYEQALVALARLETLDRGHPGIVARDELDKARAELKYADALRLEAREKQAVERKEAELAAKILEQHTIKAPITGIVLDRTKNPGESVRANEPVLRIAKTDRYKFIGWVPLEVSQRLRAGDVVRFQAVVPEADLQVEKCVFDGKIIAVNKEGTIGNTEVSVVAEIINPSNEAHPELELIQGLRGEITIIKPVGEQAAGIPARALDTATASNRAR